MARHPGETPGHDPPESPVTINGIRSFDGYLEKPIRYKEFLASIAALLRGKNE